MDDEFELTYEPEEGESCGGFSFRMYPESFQILSDDTKEGSEGVLLLVRSPRNFTMTFPISEAQARALSIEQDYLLQPCEVRDSIQTELHEISLTEQDLLRLDAIKNMEARAFSVSPERYDALRHEYWQILESYCPSCLQKTAGDGVDAYRICNGCDSIWNEDDIDRTYLGDEFLESQRPRIESLRLKSSIGHRNEVDDGLHL